MRDTLIVLYHFWRAKQRLCMLKTPQSLHQWRQKRLTYFKHHILKNSPFYRDYLHRPFEEFPFSNKQLMMENFDTMNTAGVTLTEALNVARQAENSRDFAPMLGDITVGLSSGTSGKQSVFLADRRERLQWAGIMLAKALQNNLLKPQKIAFFLRANSNLYTTLHNGKHIQFQFFDLTKDLVENLQCLHDYQPTIVTAPASVLTHIAQAQQTGRIHITPRQLFSVAEVLDPLDKASIETAFKQMVQQIYQCTEGFLGITKSNGKLYLNEEYLYIEKEWIDKASGRFVPIITDLFRTTQPIVRYRLDDILVEDFSDTSPFTCLKAIEGRCDDLCYLESYSGHHTPLFADVLRQAIAAADITYREYKIVQHTPRQMEIQLLPIGSITHQQAITAALQRICEQQNCMMPELNFTNYVPQPLQKKHRRIENIWRSHETPHTSNRC